MITNVDSHGQPAYSAFGLRLEERRMGRVEPLDMSHSYGPLLPGQSIDARFVLNTGTVVGNYTFALSIMASDGK